jgi:hypothetical protein
VSRDEPTTAGVGHDVYLLLPLLPVEATDRLVAALHRADRRLGVASGREGDGTRLILLTREPDEQAARAKAIRLVDEASKGEGLAHELADGVEIQRVARRALSPGRPRPVNAPADLPYRAVELRGGDVLRAAHEGPLGNWTVYLEGAEDRAWTGRSLRAVLSELLELPHGRKEDWVYEVIRRLAGRETPLGARYACPCCDCYTLDEPPPGTFVICPVCWWEDDNVQFADPDLPGGPNGPSLRQARESYRRVGVSKERHRARARRPFPEERPDRGRPP